MAFGPFGSVSGRSISDSGHFGSGHVSVQFNFGLVWANWVCTDFGFISVSVNVGRVVFGFQLARVKLCSGSVSAGWVVFGFRFTRVKLCSVFD